MQREPSGSISWSAQRKDKIKRALIIVVAILAVIDGEVERAAGLRDKLIGILGDEQGGAIAGIIPWIVIMMYFLGAINSGGEAKPPAFVYAIIPTIFVFFNIFAVNMFLQYKKVGP